MLTPQEQIKRMFTWARQHKNRGETHLKGVCVLTARMIHREQRFLARVTHA